MEELQSTEILDREILEDARKKAHRILKTAEDTIKAKAADWEKNLGATLDKLEQKYAGQGKRATDEIMARLPIDKQRTKAKKIEALLYSAVESWYAGLSRERVLELLKKELENRLAVSDKFSVDSGIQACIHKIERKEAEALLKAVLPSTLGTPSALTSCTIETMHSLSAYPEIIIETPEVRIHASIGKAVDFYLGEKRAELVEALLGQMNIAGENL